jgi:hypothetical protein
MQRGERPILGFRRRLLRAIDDRCDGRYTVLARRAGIPISTLEHYLHHAKHLPGGEHLLRMADALGLPVLFLMAGDGAGPASEALPSPRVVTHEGVPLEGIGRQLVLPVFRCGCPDACPLTAAVPPVARAHTRLVLEAALVARQETHRLLGIQVDPRLPCEGWPGGARVVVDWEARSPQWAALTLLHSGGRCRLGHVMPAVDHLLFAARLDGVPEGVPREGRVLGTIVAGVTAL